MKSDNGAYIQGITDQRDHAWRFIKMIGEWIEGCELPREKIAELCKEFFQEDNAD